MVVQADARVLDQACGGKRVDKVEARDAETGWREPASSQALA